jgi:hypothetical protein
VTLPKPMTSGIQARGRFGKQDFVYLPEEDIYRCPAGERLRYYYTNVEDGLKLRHYWTNACRTCALKSRCTTGVQRRIKRGEHEHVLEAVANSEGNTFSPVTASRRLCSSPSRDMFSRR